MTLLNPAFEEQGISVGDAEHWMLTSVCTAEDIAAFDENPSHGWEGFERWYDLPESFDEVEAVLCFFDSLGEGFDDFEEGWGNSYFFFNLSNTRVLTCLFDDEEIEDMETGWDNSQYVIDWTGVSAVSADFDGEDSEAFEVGWHSNENYLWSWRDVTTVMALFDGLLESEQFEGDWLLTSTI